jgi:transcriptional regulator with PAS, ATPase and Fis domain
MTTLPRSHDTISANIDNPSPIRADPVVALRDNRTGALHRLEPDKTPIVIGGSGSPETDIVLDDPYVSARHCLLERRSPDRLIVRDLGSKNGVRIESNLVEIAEIRPGTRLRLGRTELVALSQRIAERRSTLDDLVGEHPAFRRAVDLAIRAGTAASECSVLILGETGTGKELFARLIHEASRRAAGPFDAINCGALSTELLGSELFGHVRGAFTGAVNDRPGVFVHASGGTVFLDELGELPRSQQPHLLRVLETRRIRPIGGTAERSVDVRIVAATNRLDPVGDQILREDLYHRIATVVIEIPPLRHRRSDIPLLVEAFLDELSDRPRTLAEPTMAALLEHDWPGNVRELRGAIWRAATLCPGELTLDALLPDRHARGEPAAGAPASLAKPANATALETDDDSLEEKIRTVMREAIRHYGSMRRAARALGVAKSTFSDRARRLGLSSE